MVDVARREITEFVYRRLVDPKFRKQLTVTATDGTRPIVVALPSDPVSRLVGDIDAVGRSANVVIAFFNGAVVLAVTETSADDNEPATLSPDCTVGVFLARLWADGGESVYRFIIERPDHTKETGSVEVVGLAT